MEALRVSAPFGASMAGSRAVSAREPGQVRKEAALSGHRQAQRDCPTGALDGERAGGPVSKEGARSPYPPTPMASLYRRHRPRTFADVVGQEHVVRTLR